jgi:serine/threonine-protein kinase RsbT
MASTGAEVLPVSSSEDVVTVRRAVRTKAIDLGFSLVDQTKIVTAASELARNTVLHGGGGVVHVETLQRNGRAGIRMIFEDKGPGIADIDLAMKDGHTTGNGLGLGLGGSKRLVNEFEIWSRVGEGTRVTAIRWKA